MALISVREFAKLHGKREDVTLARARRGGFKTAYKMGSIWVIDENEEYLPLKRGKKAREVLITDDNQP